MNNQVPLDCTATVCVITVRQMHWEVLHSYSTYSIIDQEKEIKIKKGKLKC